MFVVASQPRVRARNAGASGAGADQSRLTRPNNDGPIRLLQPQTTFSAKKTLEFWSDGSVHADTGVGNPWPSVGSAGGNREAGANAKWNSISARRSSAD